ACYHSGLGQSDSTLYYFQEVGMYIKMPSKFEIVPAVDDEKLRSKGERTMEEANNIDIDASSVINLLSVRQGQFNYLNITATPCTQSTAVWNEENKEVNKIVYKTFADKVPPQNIDTVSTVVRVDGLVMNKFEMTLRLTPSMTMKMIMLSKLHKGHDFGICYVFVDAVIGKEFDRIVYASLFEK
ncbi:MAG TPA: hypothetical protein VGB56_10375, partial [Flavisolibacter sp.]